MSSKFLQMRNNEKYRIILILFLRVSFYRVSQIRLNLIKVQNVSFFLTRNDMFLIGKRGEKIKYVRQEVGFQWCNE